MESKKITKTNFLPSKNSVPVYAEFYNELRADVASLIGEDPNIGLTALSGGGQSGATVLAFGYNEVTTVAASGDSTLLPEITTNAVGKSVIVKNDGANSMDVYPYTDEIIDDNTANVAIPVGAGATVEFRAIDDTHWESDAEGVTVNSLNLYSADAGTTGPNLDFYHDSASPADLDVIAITNYYGEDSAGNKELYAKTQVTISDVTSGTEDAVYQIFTEHSGSMDTLPQVQVSNTAVNATRTDDGAEGMAYQTTHYSTSPAASDEIGFFKSIGYDSDGNTQEYAQLASTIKTPTSGSEEGELQVKVAKTNGTVTEVARFTPTGLTTTQNIGTANTGVTATEYGDGRNFTTVLTISQTDALTLGDNVALADGYLLYTLPAGACVTNTAYMSVSISAASTDLQADQPDVGLGTTIGSGANATLDAVAAGAENIITGQTAANVNGTATVKTIADQALAVETGDNHTIYFNVADTWANDATGDLTADISGTVVINWTFMN